MKRIFGRYLSCFLFILIQTRCTKNIDEIYFCKYAFEDAKVSNPLIIDLHLNKTKRFTDNISQNSYILTDSTMSKGNLKFDLEIDSHKGLLKTKNEEGTVHVFQRVTGSNLGLSSDEVMIHLRKNVWKKSSIDNNENDSFTIETYYNFNKDTLNKVKKYLLNGEIVRSEVQSYKYFIRNYKNHYFLQIVGFHKQNEFNVIIEIRKVSESILQFSGIKSFEMLKLTKADVSKKEFSENNSVHFQICNEDLIGQYYYNNLGSQYNGGNQKIKEIVSSKIKESNRKTDNGYIRIRFIINCEGNTGHFSILEVDENYRVTRFSRELVANLFATVENLDNWTLGRLTENGGSYDNYKHITFKIKNGKVLEVVP